jgi:hypothetical protein
VEVVRLISLVVYTKGKYGFLGTRPLRVLPHGLVEIEWAAWGTNAVQIYAGDASRKIPLTDMTLSGFLQGAGVMRVTASKAVTATDVRLVIEVDKSPKVEAEARFEVVQWKSMKPSQFTGQLLGLAVAAPKMALLTTDGLWIAKVGADDFDGGDDTAIAFSRPATTDRPKAWLALAALGQRFVALRQTNENDLQVAFFNSDGNPDEVLPIDLPPDMRRFMGGGKPLDLAVHAGRAYITGQSLGMAGPVRRAFSVNIDSAKKAEFRPEPLLETMVDYQLLPFDNALYAVNRRSGQMFRFSITPEGKLEPYKAATAVGQDAASMVQDALLVPVGRVLAVLSPNSIPSLVSLAKVGLQNVLKYQNLTPLKAAATITQDVVYSPQDDRWVRCGHGLDVKAGVVAFRGGDSPRLWLIEPNGNTYTLTVGTEHLFLHDYVTNLPSKKLPAFLNKQRQFKIINNSTMQFVPMAGNETCRRAGVTPFSATGPVEMIPPPLTNLRPGIPETFELRYNEADPPSTALRFLVQRPGGIKNEYFLELTLSGADLSTATTVFKRIATDRIGNLSIAEVPGTRQQHSTAGAIEFSAKPLVDGIKLTTHNRTPYQLWLRSPEARDEADREKPFTGEISIKYDTPAFSIYAHGAGELFFEVDFALPNGIEVSWNPDERPAKRLRVNISNSRGLNADSISVQETSGTDLYECALRYNYWRPQAGVYIGDGVFSKDGASLYLPLASLTGGTRSEVLKIRTADLLNEANITLDGGNVFSTPNSIAILADKVLGMFRNNWLSQLTPALKSEGGLPLHWHDVITNLKGSPNENKFFTVGMKQESANPPKYSYSYVARSYSQPSDQVEMLLDQQKGFRPARVPGAPAWVSPNTISPMDVCMGVAFALCVEGGVFAGDVKSKRIMEIGIDGTGREEGVVIDPSDLTIFCAHARPDNKALMISRINPRNLSDNQTITLPSPVVDMVTDTNPPVGPNLRYNRPRAVSLIVMPEVLFVSHGTKIYVLDKRRLTERQQLALDLPCRISGVRRMKAPGETHPRYGTPGDCYMVFAIGSMYVGDGQSRSKYQTNLYKIAVVV